MSRCWLVLASVLTFVPGIALAADPAGCPYPATTDPAPFDRSDVINDSVTSSDPVQTGRLTVTETTAAAPTCTSPDAAPDATDIDAQFHYKAYSFRNYSGASACVSVTVYHTGQGQPLQVAAYSPTFDPTTVNANYLAAVHNDALATYQFSFTVGASTDFEVVLNDAASSTEANDSGAYQLLVGGCGEPGVDAGVFDGGLTTVATSTSSDTVTSAASSPSSGGQSATPPQASSRTNGALPANEGFGDCSASHGSPRDTALIVFAIALGVSGIRRRRRNDLR